MPRIEVLDTRSLQHLVDLLQHHPEVLAEEPDIQRDLDACRNVVSVTHEFCQQQQEQRRRRK
jgi:hypothetical protein